MGKAKLEGLMSKLNAGIGRKDLKLLQSAVADCQAEGIPERELRGATSTIRQIGQMLAKLRVAVQLHDIGALQDTIAECQAAHLPNAELEEAIATKNSIEKLFLTLTDAIDRGDKKALRQALQDCSIDMLKTAVEQCRTAGVPEIELENALTARAQLAETMSVAERNRLLQGLRTCNDEEKRATYNQVVSILRDAIRTGGEVPPQFDDLMNELIIDQCVM